MVDHPGEMRDKGKMTQDEYELIISSVDENAEPDGKRYSTKIFFVG